MARHLTALTVQSSTSRQWQTKWALAEMVDNDRKILDVLLGELAAMPDRYDGYRDDMTHLLTEVLHLERTHTLARINIVQKIGDQVNTVGMSLHKSCQNSAE